MMKSQDIAAPQSLPNLPILPYELYGEPHLPVVVLFSCSPLPVKETFKPNFIEDLAESYHVIIFSLPSLSQVKDPDRPFGYSIVESMTMLYRTFLHFNLLPELQNVNDEVEERLRRLSTVDEDAILESTAFLSSKTFEGIRKSFSSSPPPLKEERKDEPLLPSTEETCNAPKTKFYPRRSQENLILDDTDLLEDEKELPSDASSLLTTPANVNIFNQDEIRQKNEEVIKALWSRTNSMENLLLPEERPFQQLYKSPGKPTTQTSPLIKLSSKLETHSNRLHGVLGQDSLSNYLLLLYQNQFPDHFSQLILMNYGMKNSFYLSDFFMILPWEWFLVVCLLCCVLLKLSWINILFTIVVRATVFFHEVLEWMYFFYWNLFKASSGSSRIEVEYIRRRRQEFNHWKQEMFAYSLNENVWIYYQLWRMRIAGSALTPRDPSQCSILFMVRAMLPFLNISKLLYCLI